MEKKVIHIVSHSHLDREWYMPLIEHQMYLIDLIDNIIKLSNDKRFNSFHLDGQLIPLEDYFKVKPENREIVNDLIKNNKLRIGPFYILQDCYLTSSESNLRNIQVGINEMKNYIPDYINNMNIGYFPDTFGNPGQIPQILKRANIDVAYFGRGVKTTGFNNMVSEDYESKSSELIWESPDGTKVLGILFANWYCNGVNIPSDEKYAKEFWDKKINDVLKYASTKHLLFMNGCDHSPLQMDILDAIDLAQKLYPEYEFRHSNLNDYTKLVIEELREKNICLDNIKGELRSQRTDGWYTLTGTSSNRVYLKKQNKKAEYLLEEQVEPILTSIYSKEKYPYEKVNYAWKTLMSNHPHDSICGCSIDSVHSGMEERFKEVIELSNHLVNRSFYYYSKNVDTREYKDEYLFTTHNITQYKGVKKTEVEMELKRIYFSDMFFEDAYKNLNSEIMPKSVKIYDKDKLLYETNLKFAKVMFDYELPEDKFRIPYFAKKVKFDAFLNMEAFSRKTFIAKFSNEEIKEKDNVLINKNVISNNLIEVSINEDGTFNIFDKEDNNKFTNLGIFENTGDVGNEYIFKESLGDRIYSNNRKVDYEIIRKNSEQVIVKIYDELIIPRSAEDKLLQDQIMLNEITKRKLNRSSDLVKLEIVKTLEISSYSKLIKMNIRFKNIALDHRLRMLFKTNIHTEYVNAESIYEVAKRNILPYKEWKNPDNSQNFNRFVNLRDEEKGITIGSDAIAEYEVIDKNTLALTIGRYTGELGDWGYFPTEGSQSQRDIDLNIYINIHSNEYLHTYHNVLEARKIYLSNQVPSNNKGDIKANLKFNIDVNNLFVTAFKRSYDKEMVLRLCNYTNEEILAKFNKEKELDIIENSIIDNNKEKEIKVSGYEIRTYVLEE